MSDYHYTTVECPNCKAILDLTVEAEYGNSYARVNSFDSPAVGDVENDSAVTTGDGEDTEGEPSPHTDT